MSILNNYTRTMINSMSRATATPLTDRHMEILEWCYGYYVKNGVGPLYFSIKKALSASKEEINSLFPFGLNSIYTWVGIPIQSADNTCKPPAVIHVHDYREVYFDHNATTYTRPEVSLLLIEYFDGQYGFANPSSGTAGGKAAFDRVYESRMQIAHCLNVSPETIYFTGCGSESNNMALKGIAYNHIEKSGIAYNHTDKKGHIVTSIVEHPSVLNTVAYLQTLGFDVTFVGVDKSGRVNPDDIRDAIRSDTMLVSIMAVNNEIGVINPIEEIGKICRDRGVPFVVDAMQGFGKIEIDPEKMGIDILTFSGHKIYAPKGIAGLYINPRLKITPLIHGGGQESGLRSGTENVAYIMALGKATKLIFDEMDNENLRLSKLRAYMLDRLQKIEPDLIINGSMEHRISNNINIGFPFVDSGSLLLSLNAIGISVSVGSACSAGKFETSTVIKALGVNPEKYGVIRISFGVYTTKDEVDYFLKYIPEILRQIKTEPSV